MWDLDSPHNLAEEAAERKRRSGIYPMPPHAQSKLEPKQHEKLLKICGLFRSPFDGERAAAAARASELLERLGMSWADAIRPPGPSICVPQPWQAKVSECLARPELLNPKERDFLTNARTFPRLSERQAAWLDAIYAKVAP